MRTLILSGEAAAAATTRQPPTAIDGTPMAPGKQVDWRPRMLLRFVPVDDTYTEGERIQIAHRCESQWKHSDDGRQIVAYNSYGVPIWGDKCRLCDDKCMVVVATATVARVLPIYDNALITDWPHSDLLRISDHGIVRLWRFEPHPLTKAPFWHVGASLSDHLPFVTFTPGGTAIELTDVQPC